MGTCIAYIANIVLERELCVGGVLFVSWREEWVWTKYLLLGFRVLGIMAYS